MDGHLDSSAGQLGLRYQLLLALGLLDREDRNMHCLAIPGSEIGCLEGANCSGEPVARELDGSSCSDAEYWKT